MKTISCTDWEIVTHEGIDQNEPPRKKRKKRIRSGSILHTAIILIVFLIVMAFVGNAIEFLARL